jgi:hypothetical protein
VIERAEDIAALQQAIEKWIDPARRAPARERCAEIASGYTMQRNLEQTLTVLASLR